MQSTMTRETFSLCLADIMRFSVSFGETSDTLWKDDCPWTLRVKGMPDKAPFTGAKLINITVEKDGVAQATCDDISLYEAETELWIKGLCVQVLKGANALHLLSR